MENSIRKSTTRTLVTVDSVYESDFQKAGTITAQLRQVLTTVAFYPSKQISNDKQDNVFSMEEFGFSEQEFSNDEKRVAWIDVPVGASIDDVLAKLPKEATLYRMLSNRPILTSNQSYAIDEPSVDATLDTFADRQLVRYGEGHAQEGQIVRDNNGKPQYRAVFFSKTTKVDIDQRTSEAEDFYASVAVKAELAGVASVVEGQTLQ